MGMGGGSGGDSSNHHHRRRRHHHHHHQHPNSTSSSIDETTAAAEADLTVSAHSSNPDSSVSSGGGERRKNSHLTFVVTFVAKVRFDIMSFFSCCSSFCRIIWKTSGIPCVRVRAHVCAWLLESGESLCLDQFSFFWFGDAQRVQMPPWVNVNPYIVFWLENEQMF